MPEPTVVGKCWSCGRELTPADLGRESLCPGCGKATRSCRNCRFYQPGQPDDCVEPMAERVLDKERANFCEYFEPDLDPRAGPGGGADEDLRAAAEALFKD
ncbi:MAG: hypothetical protein PVF91_00310 [Chromatiales bacterium]|jgi:predicted RNA-binding Zn-ribbon protein involved in translation (DUF1610 family)